MLNLFRSNRLTCLLESLCDLFREPPQSPLEPEWLCVPNLGVRQWLGFELAQRLGVWANARMPFAGMLIEAMLERALGTQFPEIGLYKKQQLTWCIMRVLPDLLDQPDFKPLRMYLQNADHDVKRFQLCRRIAGVFDRYVLYRYKMVLEWDAGRCDAELMASDQRWQPQLWRALTQRYGAQHLAAAVELLFKPGWPTQAGIQHFPRRLSLFGFTSLPPLYIHVLNRLSDFVDINLFILNPSREYWSLIRSKRDLIRQARHQGLDLQTLEDELTFSEGHPLLAALGKMGSDFQAVLEEMGEYDEPGPDLYVDPLSSDDGHLLGALQSDMLNLRRRGPDFDTLWPADKQDRSVSIHCCHSPLREVQVIKDQLLALLDQDPTLAPHDIAVMSPNIEKYVPSIEAVFGSATTEGEQAIPYGISDRSPQLRFELYQLLTAVLKLQGSRVSAQQVLDLLEFQSVREKFALAREDVTQVRIWVQEAGIRWGMDGSHRTAFGQPETYANTWQFGLDRLFLGYATSGEPASLFNGVLPFPFPEGAQADLLGAVADFCQVCFDLIPQLDKARPLADWCLFMESVLKALAADNDANRHHRQALIEWLAALSGLASRAGYAGAVRLEAVTELLEDFFKSQIQGRGFLSGGVTFCSMLPMRSIPFKVICLMGMNEDEFPRPILPLGFDLTARSPRLGDRSPKNEDRYLFIEALMAAQSHLLVTYTGRNLRDDRVLPPSIVVEELVHCIGEGSYLQEEAPAEVSSREIQAQRRKDVEAWLVVHHPMQPFHGDYFRATASGLFSYSALYAQAAGALQGQKPSRSPFIESQLPAPATSPDPTVLLDDLVRFFKAPTAYFLQNRLGIFFKGPAEAPDDREPFDLSGLEKYQATSQLLEQALDAQDLSEVKRMIAARGVLPLGPWGALSMESIEQEIQPLLAELTLYQQGTLLEPLEIDIEIGNYRLKGELTHIWEQCRLVSTTALLNPRHQLACWIYHLALNAADAALYPKTSLLVGRKKKWRGEMFPGGHSIWAGLCPRTLASADRSVSGWAGLSAALFSQYVFCLCRETDEIAGCRNAGGGMGGRSRRQKEMDLQRQRVSGRAG